MDSKLNSSSSFRSIDDYDFEEEEKEMIISNVFEAIIKGNNFFEVISKIKTQLPSNWNIAISLLSLPSINYWRKQSLGFTITNIFILVFVGLEGGSKEVRKSNSFIKNTNYFEI